MEGKFINTIRTDAIDSAKNTALSRLNNNYLSMITDNPTKTIYYNRNKSKSTSDLASGLEYESIGKNSPVKYNKIENMYLYGLPKMETTYEVTEFGIDGSTIGFEAVILPNTIEPFNDDYIIIPYLKETVLFRVTDVQSDTFENGANYWRITCEMVNGENKDKYHYIDKQVVETYTMILNNVGTNYKAIIESNKYQTIEKIDKLLIRLKKYYKALFYDARVQTFTFKHPHNSAIIYDAFMIEFLIRNSILEGDEEYIYVSHQTPLDETFVIDYDNSFFKCVEEKDLKYITEYEIGFTFNYINDITSIFSTRFEEFFAANRHYNHLCNVLHMIEPDLITRIINNNLYNNGKDEWKNLIIKYFNSTDIEEDLSILLHITYEKDIIFFYYIPIIIFILESNVKNLLI